MLDLIKGLIEEYNGYVKAKRKSLDLTNVDELFPLFEFDQECFDENISLVDNVIECCSTFESSSLTSFMFLENIFLDKNESYKAFAKYSGFEVLYCEDQKSKEIVALDEEDLSVFAYCAKDATSFFKAMMEVLKIRTYTLINKDSNNSDELQRALDLCTELAGGEKYSKIYKYLIGHGLD